MDEKTWKALMVQVSDAAKHELSAPAMPHPYISPAEIKSRMDKTRMLMEIQELKSGQKAHRKVKHTLGEMLYSNTPLEKLDSRTLQDLKIRHQNKGAYLICRTITKPSRPHVSGLLSIGIEDTNGWAQQLSIYNFPGTRNATTSELDTIFPLFTIMAIREPIIENMVLANQSQIRVNSPSDIVFLKGNQDPLLKDVTWASGQQTWGAMERSAQQWNEIAEKHTNDKQHVAAIAAYTYAIQRNPSLVSLRIDRAFNHLLLGNYTSVILDLRLVLKDRNVTTMDKLRSMSFMALADSSSGEYQRAKLALQTQTKGIYDWDEVFREVATKEDPNFADFIGPVTVEEMPHRGGGRGVVATRDIVPGELLVVSKAVISALPFDPLHPEPVVHLNLPDNGVDAPSTYSLFQKAMEKLSMNPDLADLVYDLYGGEQYPPLSDGVPSSGKRSFSENPLNVPVDLDPGRIKAICAQNGFKHPIHPEQSKHFDEDDGQSCLHIFPSYFNHLCVPNAGYATLPNYMIIRALRAIKEGEEVFINYGTTGGILKERTERVKNWFDVCDCPLCRYDRAAHPSQAQRRQELLDQIKTSSVSLEDLKDKVQRIDASFPKDYPNLRWESLIAHSRLTQLLKDSRQTKKSRLSKILKKKDEGSSVYPDIIQSTMGALEAIGALVTDKGMTPQPPGRTEGERLPISTDQIPYVIPAAVSMCLEISRGFKVMGLDWRAKQWLKAAIWVDDKELGGGIIVFKRRHESRIKVEFPEIHSLCKEMGPDV
ncbi:hypothetical protein CPB86DRAFT_876032 [Serendipita vermifera]|nr:hypothetical protein CPB86DRAFT_876032 [Serendipita vermifera]